MPDSSAAACRGTRRTLVRVLEALLRLAHPLMPFITEEIWQRIAPLAGVRGETIMTQPYPQVQAEKLDPQAVAEMDWLQQFLLGVRRIRAEYNIAPGKPLPVLLANGCDHDKARTHSNHMPLSTLGRLESITWLEQDQSEPESATALVDGMKILIPMAGLIDKEAESIRLSREIDKLHKDLDRGETKLANADFLARAPAHVVEKERNRVSQIGLALAKLEEQRERIGRL